MSVGTYPAHQVDFAPGVAASDVPGGGDWVEVTSAVLEWSTKWGAEDEFTQPGAGTADLLLDNSGGDFDPDNASGPYFGDLLPYVWVRILVGTTAANIDAFYGHVSRDGFQVGASQYPDSIVKVRLVDDVDLLANMDLPGSVYEVEVEADSPALWWRLGDAGTEAVDASGNGRHGTYEGTPSSGQGLIVGDAGQSTSFDGTDDRVTLPSFTPGNAFTIEVWVQAEEDAGTPTVLYLLSEAAPYYGVITLFQTNGDDTIDYAYTNPATGSSTVYRSTATVFDGDAHHVVVTQSGATTNLYVDNVEGKTLIAGSAANITWSTMAMWVGSTNSGSFLTGTLDELALFNTALSGARVTAHHDAGAEAWQGDLTSARLTRTLDLVDYPSTQRNINTGHSTMQPASLGGTAGAAIEDVAKAEGGAVYVDHMDGGRFRFIDRRHRWQDTVSVTSVVTIGDSGAEVPAAAIDLVDDRIINVATVQRAGGAAITVDESAGSVYGRQTLSETGLLHEDDAESRARAERWVAEKQDRHRRVRSFTLEPRKSTHPAWDYALAGRMNNRVTVKWRPTYGGTRSYDGWVIGIGRRWNHRAGFQATFWLAPVPYDATDEPYWLAGVSLCGETTRAGY